MISPNQVESSFVLDLRAGNWCRDRGRSEEEVPSRSGTAPALRRQLDEVGGDDCDSTTVVGLATQDLELHEKEMHLRFHELTTDRIESAVESLNVTNCKFTSSKVTYFVQRWSVEQRTFECDPSLH